MIPSLIPLALAVALPGVLAVHSLPRHPCHPRALTTAPPSPWVPQGFYTSVPSPPPLSTDDGGGVQRHDSKPQPLGRVVHKQVSHDHSRVRVLLRRAPIRVFRGRVRRRVLFVALLIIIVNSASQLRSGRRRRRPHIGRRACRCERLKNAVCGGRAGVRRGQPPAGVFQPADRARPGERRVLPARPNPLSHPPLVWPYLYLYAHTRCRDSRTARTLSNNTHVKSKMSAEKCTSTCQEDGSSLRGDGIRCGTALGAFSPTSVSDCNMPCSGNSAQLCGSGNPSHHIPKPRPNRPPARSRDNVIETSTETDFGLAAVFRDGSPTVLLRVLDISVDTVIVTSCAICPTRYASLDHGHLHALQADVALLGLQTVAPPAALSYAAHGETATSYCGRDGRRAAAGGGGVRQPLCPNGTAGGRPDVVWAPRADHAHYIVTDCRSVNLVIDYCAECSE
ncbi:hypothetical protein C8R44DRAFT_930364 [Mycena epipterygia]|nr:hypothetical protein C8R44DRAFT_930364 [Mycena epipterygia]